MRRKAVSSDRLRAAEMPASPPPPWYRQGWPWFLILLPASVVVAALFTLGIAIRNDDSLVSDDYYKDGLAINRELAKDRFALSHGLSATLSYHADTQGVELTLAGSIDAPQRLRLDVVHPTDSERDLHLQLHRVNDGSFAGRAPTAISGKWYLKLESDADASPWRLRGTLQVMDPAGSATAVLAAE